MARSWSSLRACCEHAPLVPFTPRQHAVTSPSFARVSEPSTDPKAGDRIYDPYVMNTTLLTASLLSVFSVSGALVATSLMTQDAEAPALEFPAASPNSTLTQRVGVTDIALEYARPSMRGRKVFGGLEPYGVVWRTGANQATKVSFSTDVQFGGADVPAGDYALFSVPGESEWKVMLNASAQQFGAYGYDESQNVASVTVKPIALTAPVESLAFGFSDLRPDSATLFFEWENVRVPVEIKTDVVATLVPRIEAAMAGEGDLPYFSAAMFYYENDVDLDKAAAWIDEAVKAQPEAFWVSYRKGLILLKKGDKQGAMEAAKMSLELASKRSGSLKDEYTRLNEALIARCK